MDLSFRGYQDIWWFSLSFLLFMFQQIIYILVNVEIMFKTRHILFKSAMAQPENTQSVLGLNHLKG